MESQYRYENSTETETDKVGGFGLSIAQEEAPVHFETPLTFHCLIAIGIMGGVEGGTVALRVMDAVDEAE